MNVKEKDRMFCILWYLLVIVCIGLPMWWLTTRVQRATIPIEEIPEVMGIYDDIYLNVFVVFNENQPLTNKQNLFLQSLTQFFITNHISINNYQGQIKVRIDIIQGIKNVIFGQIGDFFLVKRTGKNFTLGPNNIIYYNEFFDGFQLKNLFEKLISGSSNLIGYDLHVSLVNNRLLSQKMLFDSRKLKTNFLNEFKSKLVNNGTLFVQNLSFKLTPDSNSFWSWQLELAVPALDQYLFSSSSIKPVLNFIVYFVTHEHSNTSFFYENGEIANSGILNVIIPSWGGVILIKLPQQFYMDNNSQIFKVNEEIVAKEIIEQMKHFLLLPKMQDSMISDLDEFQVENWQFHVTILNRLFRQYDRTIANFKALAETLSKISVISVDQEKKKQIADEIRTSIDLLNKAKSFLNMKRFNEAIQFTNDAFFLSESIFRNPKLMADSYFPDNQRYAIYLPIFVPLIVPVLSAPMILFKYYRKIHNNEFEF